VGSVLSVKGKKVLHIDRNDHYGGYVFLLLLLFLFYFFLLSSSYHLNRMRVYGKLTESSERQRR
jgi:hypothetical protein